MAYSNIDIRDGGSGCLLWFHDLLDIRQLYQEGQDIYIRIAASELGKFVAEKQLAIICDLLLENENLNLWMLTPRIKQTNSCVLYMYV